jgi:ParB family transcriptional regulator, chromosome partitioning protein
MLGKGLESLIPKKDKSSDSSPDGTGGSPTPAAGDHLRSHPNESLSATPSSLGLRELPHGEESELKRERVLGGATKRHQDSIFHIEVEKIKPNPYQPRRTFNKEDLAELAASIREFGIIQPLVVTKTEKEISSGTEVEYQLVAGERRLMAAKLIGLPRVPAVIKRFDTHQTKLEVALVENIQRSDLNPVEAARAYARLQDEFGLTQREIAARVGKSRETVANTVRLLNLPGDMQEALQAGHINESQARVILAAEPTRQNELFQKFLGGRTAAGVKSEAVKESIDPEVKYWERRLEEKLGHPVEVRRKGDRGKLVVKFHSREDWQALIDKIMGDETLS